MTTFCSDDTTILEAARQMARSNGSALLVQNQNTIEGIVTDADLQERVNARELDITSPISRIMSQPVISINDESLFPDFTPHFTQE